MRPLRLLPALVIIGIGLSFLLSCGSFNRLSITPNFASEIAQQQNLVFAFDRDLATDSMLGKWDTIQYIKFTPAIHGKFSWTAKNELTFSPAAPFKACADYTGEYTVQLLRAINKKPGMPDEKEFHFHTPYLKVASTGALWGLSQRHPGVTEVRINIAFNYKVDPLTVSKYLHVNVNNKAQAFEVASMTHDQQIQVALLGISAADNDRLPLTITIDPGLKNEESDNPTKTAIAEQTEIPARGKFMVERMQAYFVENEGVVRITTTHAISDEHLTDRITVEPAVKFTVEAIDDGIMLKGDFAVGKDYKVSVSKDLRSAFDKTLGEDYGQYVSFGTLLPSVSFVDKKSIYLSNKGMRNIAIKLANVQKVKVTIVKIYQNNITEFLRSRYNYDYYRSDPYDDEGHSYYDDHPDSYEDNFEERFENYGNKVSEKVYNSASLPKTGNLNLLKIDLTDLQYSSTYKGIYMIKVSSLDKQWVNDVKMVSISDIGLIAKQSGTDMLVFANSIKDATPLPGVKVNLVSTNNQIYMNAVTDQDGVAAFKNMAAKQPFKVNMVTAGIGEDFNYMLLNDTRVETSHFDVGGLVITGANSNAFIYGDRDIYRPGDTLHFNVIVRDQQWQPLKDLPVKIKLLMPTGKEYMTFKETLNNQGSSSESVYLPSNLMTGGYSIEVYTGNDVLINTYNIMVEEFVPDRIKVSATVNKAEYKSNEDVQLKINAMNLFGTPAPNRTYNVALSIKKKYFSPMKYNDYNFDINSPDDKGIDDVTREGKTDDNGNASESFKINNYEDRGTLQGSVLTTVFDETARPVYRVTKFDIQTQDVFFGIKYLNRWIDVSQNINVPVVAVDKNGNAANAKARVELIRYRYESVVEKRGDRFYYNTQKRDEIISDNTITLNGGGNVSLRPTTSGEYEVRIMRPGAVNYVSEYFYAYGYGYTDMSSFDVSNEGEVDIKFDKTQYSPGENAKVMFTAPFSGRLLVCVERNKVYSYRYVDMDKKAASFTLPITADMIPNVYISAVAIHSMSPNTPTPLMVARGYAPLMVEAQTRKLPVTISLAGKSRSKTFQKVVVTTAPYAKVTLAGVDEGILQLRNFKTPDPFGYFYQKRGLEITGYDLYPYLFPERSGSLTSTGADLAKEFMGKRNNPVKSKRFKLLSYWSNVRTADANGNVVCMVNVPQFSGAIRFMAVAYKDNAFGNKDETMIVADPIVISTGLPRFISPGDNVNSTITLTNTTANTAYCKVAISSTGELNIAGGREQSVTIKPGGEAVVKVGLNGVNAGEGAVKVSVTALGETFTDNTDISIRTPASLQKTTGEGAIAANSSQTFNLMNEFEPSSTSTQLVISRSPLVQFSKDLSYLIRYPYGCVEQTVSTAFPQLYYGDLAKALMQDKKAIQYNPKYNVQQAILKLESMQLYNGSLSYWPNGDEECWWGTIYAGHFLFEAKRAGYEVNDHVLQNIYTYLKAKMKDKLTETYHYYDNNGKLQVKTIAPREAVYSLYVLAIAGKQDMGSMNYYKAQQDLLSIDSRYLLACAYAHAGDYISFKQILPANFSGETSTRQFGGSFYSFIRDQSMALNALLESNPTNVQIPVLAKHLTEQLKKERWLSTQEAAFEIMALGKYASQIMKGSSTATVTVDGKTIANYTGQDVVISQNLSGKKVSVNTTGTAPVFYSWTVQGVNKKGTNKEEDSYLQVRKQFYDRFGKPIDAKGLHQNDLVVIKISLKTSEGSSVDNIAVTDLLPACFEIENPRISALPELTWIKDDAKPDYMDIRDDRINFFTSANGGTKYFYYPVRVVSKGTYTMGAVAADAMYNDDYHSYNGAGSITIK